MNLNKNILSRKMFKKSGNVLLSKWSTFFGLNIFPQTEWQKFLCGTQPQKLTFYWAWKIKGNAAKVLIPREKKSVTCEVATRVSASETRSSRLPLPK
jgi:hypothetical protein